MAAIFVKLFVVLSIALPLINAAAQEGVNNYLDVEAPTFFQYNSPLARPESLRSRPYYDFLSTLYRRDATKSNLFRSYNRTRRDVAPVEAALAPAQLTAAVPKSAVVESRKKRAIIFRPIFVYRQQEVRKEELRRKRKRV